MYWSEMSSRFHKVTVRRLYTPGGRGLSKSHLDTLSSYQREMVGKKFKTNPLAYVAPLLAIEESSVREENLSAVCCSELVAGARVLPHHSLAAALLAPPIAHRPIALNSGCCWHCCGMPLIPSSQCSCNS